MWYMKAYSKSLFSCRIIGCTPNFQGIRIFRRETRIKRENLKKVNSDGDNRLLVVCLFIIKIFFSSFKIDFFPKYQINFSKLFWFWNFRWWSTLWAEKLFLKVVYIGFKYTQKVFFVSFKKLTNSRLSSSLLIFFKFSLFIRVPLLKIHIPWKFGVHPSFFHEKILFVFGQDLMFWSLWNKKNIRIIVKKLFWWEKDSNYHPRTPLKIFRRMWFYEDLHIGSSWDLILLKIFINFRRKIFWRF